MVESRILRIAFLGALLLSEHAFAVICLPIPHFRYVGDVATDSNCTDNDIQTAINNVVCPNTTVIITQEHSYAAQELTVYNKSLTIAGVGPGVKCGSSIGVCDPSVGCGGGGGAPPPPAITLHGTGSTSVLFIYGTSSVTLQSIELTGGGGLQGGGILYGGTGALTLVDSTIVYNSAGQGGGIYFAALGGSATLTLGAGTIIDENTANSDGGGIYLGGSTRMLALAPYTFIGYNHAPNGYGGGIAVEGAPPVVADIGSPGYNGSPVIQYNDAAIGGGIAVIAPDVASPPGTAYDIEVNLFTTDANHPGGIFSNTATQAGGGIYLKSNYDSTAKMYVASDFCATSFNIDGNVAPEGSAIYSDLNQFNGLTFYSNGVSLNPSNGCSDYDTGVTLASLGAQTCSGISCNTLNGNGALNASNQPTAGAVIYADRATFFHAYRFIMRFNQGGHAMHFVGIEPASIVDCLLADNNESAELIYADKSAIDIDSCTIANNALGGPTVIYDTGDQEFQNDLQDSIIDQPGLVTLNGGSKIGAEYLLSNDLSSLPSFSDSTQGAPVYVNAAGGDYHLQPNSPGIDYAPSYSYPDVTTPAVDLDGKPRIFDIPGIANHYGPRDVGAYERSPVCYRADTLFCDGLEGVY